MSFDIINTKPDYHELKKMKQIHHEIALLAITGKKRKDIANTLGVTPQMVTYTLQSELVQRKLRLLRGARDAEALDVQGRVRELAPLALDELEQILINPNTENREKRMIAQDILDRAGHGAIQKHADVSDKLTTEDLDDIKKLARENGMVVSNADIEDAEYTDVTVDENSMEANDS